MPNHYPDDGIYFGTSQQIEFLMCFDFLQSLLDQTDFLVVGVIGLQGTGKSTVLSLVAGNTDEDSAKYVIIQLYIDTHNDH